MGLFSQGQDPKSPNFNGENKDQPLGVVFLMFSCLEKGLKKNRQQKAME